jgi:hypothetical protein
MKKFLFLGAVITTLILALVAFGAAPAWWSDTGNSTAFIDANATVNNYAPLNVGQLKNVATKAKTYLDNKLSLIGGSGPDITAMVNGFTTNGTLDYQTANLGQLKAVAKPFYDRLLSIGYNTTANLISQGYAGNYTGVYPWVITTPTAQNYAPANLGQLKMTFSFNLTTYLTTDTDGDGVPDYLEAYYGTNPDSNNTDGGTSLTDESDGSDVFPLDPAFTGVPTGTATDSSGPTITLVTPENVILVSSH